LIIGGSDGYRPPQQPFLPNYSISPSFLFYKPKFSLTNFGLLVQALKLEPVKLSGA
jgi:hypothetical protein